MPSDESVDQRRDMAIDDEAPTADVSEQERDAVPGPIVEAPRVDNEAPLPDALEQARTVGPTPRAVTPRIAPDVPEADALDQAREVLFDEDDERRE